MRIVAERPRLGQEGRMCMCGGSQRRRCGVARCAAACTLIPCGDPRAHRKGSGLNPRAGKGSHGRDERRRASARELAKNSHNEHNIAVFVVNTLDCS